MTPPPNITGSLLPSLLAQSQQDEVIKAINNASRDQTPGWVIGALFMTALLGVTLLIIAQRHRNRKPAEPARKFVRNSRKLVKEVTDSLELSAADLKKLEHHAERAGVENPLTLLLCPSLAKKQDA